MTADDLNAPLGQQPKKRRFAIPITTSQVLGGALTLFLGAFVLWAALGNNPFGGEPMVVAKINAPSGPAASGTPNVLSGLPHRYDGPAEAPPQAAQGSASRRSKYHHHHRRQNRAAAGSRNRRPRPAMRRRPQ